MVKGNTLTVRPGLNLPDNRFLDCILAGQLISSTPDEGMRLMERPPQASMIESIDHNETSLASHTDENGV